MGTFDNYADTPFQIRFEGQEITIKFDKTGPTTGRVSWNIPPGVSGCSVENQAYCGMLVTLDTSHTTPAKSPVDGTMYTADPTADKDLHAGDSIDSSIVIGAFYDDKTTTFFDISGLNETDSYFISGYAVDCVKRYHTQGVHSYSLNEITEFGTDDTCATHRINFRDANLELTDPTGLIENNIYSFDIIIDDPDKKVVAQSFPDLDAFSTTVNSDLAVTISLAGVDAITYGDMIDTINLEFMKLDSPFTGPTPPNTGGYYWDAENLKLFQWDGFQNVEQDVIIEDNDPTIRAIGDKWFEPSTEDIFNWDGAAWNLVPYISYKKDPRILDCTDYWFNSTDSYQWSGTTWILLNTFVQTADPSLAVEPVCGTYWFDQINSILNKWDDINNIWVPDNPIFWDTDPNALVPGTYWFDDLNQVLQQWNGASWVIVPATIDINEPTTPAPNQYWVNPSTEELFQRDALNTVWNPLPVLVFDSDPVIRTSGDIWWDSISDNLFIWDITTSSWDMVVNFIQSEIDPALAPILTIGDMWFNSTAETLSRWDGVEWNLVCFINWPTDPTLTVLDDIWFNTTTSVWNIWDGANWVVFDPIESLTDPNSGVLPAGSFWFDTSSDTLQQWNGLIWVLLAFSTASLQPINGTLWLDTNIDLLKEWQKTEWIISTPKAKIELEDNHIFKFSSTSKGHASNILVLSDGTEKLFNELAKAAIEISGMPIDLIFIIPADGQDGIPDVPTFAQLGVGTDGSPDERRELIDSIRSQLGYPVVDVELTKQQWDYCIDAGLEEIRKRTGVGYKRGFFFMDLKPRQQQYILSNNGTGFNKIVQIMDIYRTTSAFISSLYDNAVYGQTVIQHLYNMGTYDLVSYHIVSDYIEQLEQLFATRVLFQWNERTRALDVMQSINQPERVLLDVSVERTEQDLIQDRFLKTWIENWAMAEAMVILFHIRGKYASLPGAGGGVALNAGDMYSASNEMKADLLMQIEDYIVELPEEYGLESTLLIG